MKFSINKNTFLKKLQLLSKATPSRSTLPIISSALFTTKGNQLSMRATDLEISINIKCDILGGEDGCIAIPLGKLLEITSVMPESDLDFNVSDIGKMNISCNSGRYTIMGQSSEEFPSEQSIENSQTLQISSKELKDIINNTSYAASKDDLKPRMNVNTPEYTTVTAMPTACSRSWLPMSRFSIEPPSASEANTPVRSTPTMPPIPWTPNTSSESSYPNRRFSPLAPQ